MATRLDIFPLSARRRGRTGRLFAFAAGFVLVLACAAGAEEIRVGWREVIRRIGSPADTVLALPPVVLVRDSVFVRADSLPLVPGWDFRVDYGARTIHLARSWPVGDNSSRPVSRPPGRMGDSPRLDGARTSPV